MRLKKVYYNIESEKITSDINIALITDLHGCYYGRNQRELVDAIIKEDVDAILFVGDIFDDVVSHKNSEILLDELGNKKTCYFVLGNHEYYKGQGEKIKSLVLSKGIKILDDTSDTLDIRGNKIQISGLSDPVSIKYDRDKVTYNERIELLDKEILEEHYSILLAHRPEYINEYLKTSFDMVLSGHAHGGQVRVPYILNGLYAPHQGVFPKYAGGIYKFESLDFIVSRGLARESTLAPRVFNRPEIVFINIK